jgi:hypothetical protein
MQKIVFNTVSRTKACKSINAILINSLIQIVNGRDLILKPSPIRIALGFVDRKLLYIISTSMNYR